jgi:hypothetical protein
VAPTERSVNENDPNSERPAPAASGNRIPPILQSHVSADRRGGPGTAADRRIVNR